MRAESFKKYEAFVAGCFLASNIDGNYSAEEHRLIYDKVMLNGERLVVKVDHSDFFRKWNLFLDKGGLDRIETELVKSLKRYPKDYIKKVIAYMENITYASKTEAEDRWQDSDEEALIDRLVEKFNLDRVEIKKIRLEVY